MTAKEKAEYSGLSQGKKDKVMKAVLIARAN
jgi:hypothetical protein